MHKQNDFTSNFESNTGMLATGHCIKPADQFKGVFVQVLMVLEWAWPVLLW